MTTGLAISAGTLTQLRTIAQEEGTTPQALAKKNHPPLSALRRTSQAPARGGHLSRAARPVAECTP